MTNIALDFLFVVGLQMGVMGAALATILSQIISAVLVMGSLMRTKDIYRLHLRKISIDWIMLKRIVRIGFPAGVQSILYSVSNVIIQLPSIRWEPTMWLRGRLTERWTVFSG